MGMLYSSIQLTQQEYSAEAFKRYLYKYLDRQKEFKRLKPHEKDFFWRCLCVTYNDFGKLAFNLYKIPEAKEYLFYRIILTYGEDIDCFNGRLYGVHGKINANQIRKDKRFFNEYLQVWKNQIETHKGPYLSIIYLLINDKLKELKNSCKSEEEYRKREKYCYGVFFYIYYKARLYFEEKKEKALIFDIQGFKFVANIYTYCHILSRHYVPSLNRGLTNSMNSNIPCIDIDNLLESLQNLVQLYFQHDHSLSESTEYLLFNINGEKYILWIKYKRLSELSKDYGFEIRSFYKCESEQDIEKFSGTKEIQLMEGCAACIKQG